MVGKRFPSDGRLEPGRGLYGGGATVKATAARISDLPYVGTMYQLSSQGVDRDSGRRSRRYTVLLKHSPFVVRWRVTTRSGRTVARDIASGPSDWRCMSTDRGAALGD